MNTLKTLIIKHTDLIVLLLIPIIAGLPHAYNMFHYPYYENDEGVYMSQAWALVRQGKMAPYTYWYDHAPGGWILIALWTLLTGGFYTFGFSINSGRMLMLILHIFSSLFIYFIATKLTKNKIIGLLTIFIFSISPLGIYFQRRVLLDNIMIFFVLFSLIYIMYNKGKLRNIIVSGILFGFSVVAKENSIFFIPFFLYCIYLYTHEKQKKFAISSWLTITFSIITFYFLYALLKGELFPAGTLLGGTKPHVSLLGTLRDQYNRPGGGILNLKTSSFWVSMWSWLETDLMIIILGIAATIRNLWIGISTIIDHYTLENKPSHSSTSLSEWIQSIIKIIKKILLSMESIHKNKDKNAVWLSGLFAASMWLFLIRGGLVIEFYIIPLLPILALNIAIICWYEGKRLANMYINDSLKFAPGLLVFIIYAITSLYFSTNVRHIQNLYTADQTTPQIEAINWMLNRTNPQDFFVIDNYGYIELHEKENNNFKNAEWYWKVDRDPEISKNILKGAAAGIDYVALTPQMEHDITTAGLDISKAAWHNSQSIARFWNDGWGVEFFATKFDSRIIRTSWDYYKSRFIVDGRTIDPYASDATTSEGQSYTLLRAVWVNDQKTFDTVWNWTKINLQQPNGLFTWKWNTPQDTGTAADADQDIALSLLFAYKRWGDKHYSDDAQHVMDGIWNTEVVTIKDLPYMTAANWANHETTITINPSYLSPATYRIFSMANPERPWFRLVGTTYWILKKCTAAKLDKDVGRLPPEWCSLNKETLEIGQPGTQQPRATEYGYNAFRTPWRVALDYVWFQSQDAKEYVSTLSLLSNEYTRRKKISTAYQHDGKVWEEYESVAAYSANLGYFIVTHPETAKTIYQNKILSKFFEEEHTSYWEDKNNYYTQNWAWFGTALYSNHLENLWSENNLSKK